MVFLSSDRPGSSWSGSCFCSLGTVSHQISAKMGVGQVPSGMEWENEPKDLTAAQTAFSQFYLAFPLFPLVPVLTDTVYFCNFCEFCHAIFLILSLPHFGFGIWFFWFC